jgi:hypothetical protein
MWGDCPVGLYSDLGRRCLRARGDVPLTVDAASPAANAAAAASASATARRSLSSSLGSGPAATTALARAGASTTPGTTPWSSAAICFCNSTSFSAEVRLFLQAIRPRQDSDQRRGVGISANPDAVSGERVGQRESTQNTAHSYIRYILRQRRQRQRQGTTQRRRVKSTPV